MPTTTKERPRPGNVRAKTNGHSVILRTNIVSVGTNDVWPRGDWPRDEFFEWFDRARPAAGFKNEYELARAAGISHSAISGWRKGRQRPSMTTLHKIADAMGISKSDIWIRAGAFDMTDHDFSEDDSYGDDAWGVELIKKSKLSDDAKSKLIAVFLEQERRDREEKERRLREQIEIISG